MMTTPARRERPMFAELVDWLEGEFPGSPLMRPFAGMQVMRVEDFIEEGRYVLRAEVPGIDPDKDVEITIDNGVLTIKAERARRRRRAAGRSSGTGRSLAARRCRPAPTQTTSPLPTATASSRSGSVSSRRRNRRRSGSRSPRSDRPAGVSE